MLQEDKRREHWSTKDNLFSETVKQDPTDGERKSEARSYG